MLIATAITFLRLTCFPVLFQECKNLGRFKMKTSTFVCNVFTFVSAFANWLKSFSYPFWLVRNSCSIEGFDKRRMMQSF